MECHTTLDRIVARRAKETFTKYSYFNPSVVNSESLVDIVIGVGEWARKKPSVVLNKSTWRAGHPKAKGKDKGMGKRKYPGKGNHNQDQAGSPNEDGQEHVGWFLYETSASWICRWCPREWWFWDSQIGSSSLRDLCSKVQECYDGFDGIDKFVDVSFWWEWGASGHAWKNDQSTGEVLFAVGCRDDRPIVDSGSVVSTCPVDHATSVPTEKVHYSMNLESVLGVSLQHYGITRNVPFTNRIGSVNFDVTDTKRAILSLHEGCGNGSMIVFTPDGKGKMVNDTKCIEQVKHIMASTPGYDIVYDRGVYVLDVDVNDGVYVNGGRRWRIITSMLTNCLEMIVFGTNWTTRHFMECQQTCKNSRKMDSNFRQTFGKIDFIHSSHQINSDKMVMWLARFSIVDWVYFKTQI